MVWTRTGCDFLDSSHQVHRHSLYLTHWILSCNPGPRSLSDLINAMAGICDKRQMYTRCHLYLWVVALLPYVPVLALPAVDPSVQFSLLFSSCTSQGKLVLWS